MMPIKLTYCCYLSRIVDLPQHIEKLNKVMLIIVVGLLIRRLLICWREQCTSMIVQNFRVAE